MKTVRYLTRYPEIFDCYWGAFKIGNGIAEYPAIIANRNRLAEENGIIRADGTMTVFRLLNALLSKHHADHPEAYRCADGSILLVFSMYNGSIHTLRNAGFTQTDPLYCLTAETWLRRMECLKACRQWLTRLQQENPWMRL
jgi:hypothetical protein